jgi:hypothetical protein
MPTSATRNPHPRGTAVVMHRSTRLLDSARTVLEQAGFVVLAVADVPATLDAVRSARATPVVVLVEHEMGDVMTPWRSLWGELPRASALVGLVEAVGPGDTPEATLVTRGERQVHGPMPMVDLPQVLGWVVAGDKSSVSTTRTRGHHP